MCEIILKFGPVAQEMLPKRFYFFYSSVAILFSKQSHLCNFGRGHCREQNHPKIGSMVQEEILFKEK